MQIRSTLRGSKGRDLRLGNSRHLGFGVLRLQGRFLRSKIQLKFIGKIERLLDRRKLRELLRRLSGKAYRSWFESRFRIFDGLRFAGVVPATLLRNVDFRLRRIVLLRRLCICNNFVRIGR
ncbi:hypothetical protein D3C80_1275480 [compost metagenome]